MACIQACGSAEAYHGKHKAAVNEVCNMAHNVVKKHHHEHGAVTGGSIKNTVRGNYIKFMTSHDWSGRNRTCYPHCIANCDSGTFVHVAHCAGQSDEAVVVYSDEYGSAWLLAWSVKDQVNGYNKVYVETGPIEDYKKINWSDIKARLNVSTDTTYFIDSKNGNEAFAKISNGKRAALAATFNTYLS